MQGWFAGPSSKGQDKDEVSVLADWNSYAARKEADEGSLSSVASAAAMDLEAGLSSAGSTLVGAFSSDVGSVWAELQRECVIYLQVFHPRQRMCHRGNPSCLSPS